VPAGFDDQSDTAPRPSRLRQIGILMERAVKAGQTLAAKMFPSARNDPIDLESLPVLLEKTGQEYERNMRSSARGGAKKALALTKAWYPDADIHQLTEFMPTEDEDGQAIDQMQLQAAVRGYATRVANMVDLGIFYKEHPDPHVATAPQAGSDAAPGLADEILAEERPTQESVSSPKVASPSPKDPAASTSQTAAP